ncbi:hypothetical protein BMS3Abin16_01089 [archaeon BMS3Abin16]|nr:hypothetical protein BMS3Abin16_01089 [archaeon BMS3Abin16]
MAKMIVVLLFLVVSISALLIWGRLSWSQYTTNLSEKVMNRAIETQEVVDLDEVDELPSPVKKYFHHVLKKGQPIISKVFISQNGGFRAKPEMAGWSEMKAVQYFSSEPRAFVWDSQIFILPLVSINVCDSYIDGKGSMTGKFLSLFTLINSHDEEELNAGALQRYLAEAVWFPTSLLPSQGISWEEIDSSKAKATITDSGITVSLEFEFNERGEAVSVYTPGRYREVKGKYELTPWKGRFSNYIEVEGYRIPTKAEVEWHLKDKTYPYWKAELIEVRYDS